MISIFYRNKETKENFNRNLFLLMNFYMPNFNKTGRGMAMYVCPSVNYSLFRSQLLNDTREFHETL